MKNNQTTLTQVWQEYQECKSYLEQQNLYSISQRCHEFVNGDQWSELKVPQGFERPAQLNILQPMMKNATALVGQHTMGINYSPLNKTTNRQKYIDICNALNNFAADTWEKLKMDNICWNVLEDAYITGDAFVYFFWQDGEIKSELLENTNLLFADENNPDIQSQPYILIPQRKYVDEIRKTAQQNGLSQEDIQNILPDEDNDNLSDYQKGEVKNNYKITVITKLYKQNGVVHMTRSTKNVCYQKATALQSQNGNKISKLSLYPIAKYSWKLRKKSARGTGEVYDKIPNQIEINKGLYRFCQVVKGYAFPHKVFLKNALSQAAMSRLDYPGASLEIQASQGQSIEEVIKYLQPAAISPYAASVWQDLIDLTRQLSGSGDNLENVNPENASGAAINAAREAKMLNVNSQVAAFKQFVEDVAIVWANLWQAYNTETVKSEKGDVLAVEFSDLKPTVRIDVYPNNPYSKMAQEIELKSLLTDGHITFEEYVDTLPETSNLPKAKLKEILQKRQVNASGISDVLGQIGFETMGADMSPKDNLPIGNMPPMTGEILPISSVGNMQNIAGPTQDMQGLLS